MRVHPTADCAAAAAAAITHAPGPSHAPQALASAHVRCHVLADLLRSNEPAPSLTLASSSFSNGSRPYLLTPHRGLLDVYSCLLAFMLSLFMAKTSLELSTRANSA